MRVKRSETDAKIKYTVTHYNKNGEEIDLSKPLGYETSKQIGELLGFDRMVNRPKMTTAV